MKLNTKKRLDKQPKPNYINIMNKNNIKHTPSYNQGIRDTLNILQQQFFAGNFEGSQRAIAQIEQLMIPVVDNGIDVENYAIMPDSVKEIQIPARDILT